MIFCFLFAHRIIDKLKDVENVHLISCLNVLDRCADPHQILTDIHEALAPNGRAIVALVLPYSHYVESSMCSERSQADKTATMLTFYFFVHL